MARKGKGLHTYSVQEAQNAGLGQSGSILIDDTATHAGPFVAITALEDAAVDVSECTNIAITMTDAADFTLPKGASIYGDFAGFALDSGKVIAYFGRS
tara:strand:+ start:106 stop:399 length:294 start_codon:yes stop_codon:yes gene_type:complete